LSFALQENSVYIHPHGAKNDKGGSMMDFNYNSPVRRQLIADLYANAGFSFEYGEQNDFPSILWQK
jgi:hypothetical protein